MKTVDLRNQSLSAQELLRMASAESLLIVADDNHAYTLEEADEFETEVARLGRSERFVGFLRERGDEPGSISLDEIEKRASK